MAADKKEDDLSDDFKNLDVDDEETFFEEQDDEPGVKKKKGWLHSVGKSLKKGGSKFSGILARSSSPTTSEDNDSKRRQKCMECRAPWASDNGGAKIPVASEASSMRAALSLMVRQAGRSLFKGGNIMNVSFPSECCQPKSILELAGAAAGCFKDYLPQAAVEKDPVERMRLVVSSFVACQGPTLTSFLKPLNPILGETLQTDYADGSSAYLEQTCHHPPVTSFLLEGPNKQYRYYGHMTFTVGFGYNKMLVKNSGLRVLEFNDGGRIDIGFPGDRRSGLFWGDMTHDMIGEWDFVDEKNGVRARLIFDPPSESGSKAKAPPSDYFAGVVERFNPAAPDGETTKISDVEGSWCGFCDFDNKRYWEHTNTTAVAWVPPKNRRILPSDSTFRSDRAAMLAGDFELANKEKIRLEQMQRSDRKFRKEGGKATN